MSVMNSGKRIYRGVLRRARRILTGSPVKPAEFDHLHRKFFSEGNVTRDSLVIFDVGAHVGESFWRFRRIFPSGVIHSFEADKGNFKNLSKNLAGQPGAYLNNFGVGSASGRQVFYKNRKTNTSSFYAVDTQSEWAANSSRKQGVSPEEFTSEAYEVDIRTLDSYMEEKGIGHIDILKIDTQGHEAEVLKGAAKALAENRIAVIETELIVGEAYKNRLSFSDLENILKPYGYSFYAIDKGGNLYETPSLSFDLIYVSDKFMVENKLAKGA